jgi:hypothetical protein
MSEAGSRCLIGYSVYDLGEECCEYNENACYIGSTSESAHQFLEVGSLVPGDARVDAVYWDDVLRDFGCSGGEYGMEADAFARFRSKLKSITVKKSVSGFSCRTVKKTLLPRKRHS